MQGKYADELTDFHPKYWLGKYRRTSLPYLLKMLLFYHGIGFMLMLGGTLIVDQIIPNSESPSSPRSLIAALAAGPIEETVFFGIPFYVLGNPYVVLATGSAWAALHILNTSSLAVNTLAFGNLLFVVPSIFFSLRTWISGKGWFAIVAHSAWNGIFFAAGCGTGEFSCVAYDAEQDLSVLLANSILFPGALVAATYLLRMRTKKHVMQSSR